jgi:hypothetical protein
MEGFQAEDRHDPLPHIAPSTVALKSVYGKTALPATHLATDLRELHAMGGPEWRLTDLFRVHFQRGWMLWPRRRMIARIACGAAAIARVVHG